MAALRRSSFTFPRQWNPAQVPNFPVELDYTHPLAAGLVNFYPLSTNGHDLAGTFDAAPFGAPVVVSSGIGLVTSFDGSSARYLAPNVPDIQLTVGTISTWIQTANAGSSFRLVLGKPNAWAIFMNANEFGAYDWGGGAWRGTGHSPNDGAWHHLALTFNSGVGSGSTFYLDGASVLSSSITVQDQTFGLSIASNNGAFAQEFAGNMSAASVYNRLLSAGEIAQLYAAPFSMLRPVVRRQLYVVATASSSLVGTSAATSTSTATLTGKGALAGTSAGVATSIATLSGVGALAGTAAAVATSAATLTGIGMLSGTAAGVATSTATFSAPSSLAGTSAATSTSVATLSAIGALAGTAAATSTSTGTLSGAAPPPPEKENNRIMLDTMTRYLTGVPTVNTRRAIRRVVEPMIDRFSSQPLTSAGLVIKAGASTLAKTGTADFYATAAGVLVKIAASTDMPALTGISMLAANFNVVCFFIDSAAVVTVAGGTQSATLGGVLFPQFPKNKALVGFLIITYASAFVGGTTALDTATTVYASPLGAFDPSVLV